MATSHTFAGGYLGGQKVAGILSYQQKPRSPSNCPARSVARVRRKNALRWTNFRSHLTATGLGLPVYLKRGSWQLRQKSSEWRLSGNAARPPGPEGEPPGDGFQGGGFMARPLVRRESSLPSGGNSGVDGLVKSAQGSLEGPPGVHLPLSMPETDLVHAPPPHEKGKDGAAQTHGSNDTSDRSTGRKPGVWPNRSPISHHGNGWGTHVVSPDSTIVPSYLVGEIGPGSTKHVNETAEEESAEVVEFKSTASSNQNLVNADHLEFPGESSTVSLLPGENDGPAVTYVHETSFNRSSTVEQPVELSLHQTVNTSDGATLWRNDGFPSRLATQAPELSKVSADAVQIQGGGPTDDDSRIAGDGSANVVDEPAYISVSNMSTSGAAHVSHANTSSLNHMKAPESASEVSLTEVSLAGASVTDVGEKVSTPVTETETLTGWRAALATALKTKSKVLDDQSHHVTETVPEQLELKPAPDDEDEGFSEALHIGKNLENKHILITGVTGFLAKVLVEKILRTQPGVGQLYLLIRAGGVTVEEKTANAVFSTSLFKPLREKYGNEKFVELIVSKVTPVSGDIAKPDLNLRPTDAQMLMQNVDVIISCAATTKFDERYDTAIKVNTHGPQRLLDFAKKCPRLSLYQHISTAYVNGKRKGVSPEIPFEYGQSLLEEISEGDASEERAVYPQLDPEVEAQLALKTWEDLTRKYPPDKNNKPHPQAVKEIVKLGTERAEMFGWQDTYTLTKAMGEQMIMKHKGDVPVVIIRPSVVESTVRLPFDGWIEGQRMLDPIVVAYGKGHLRAFLVNPETILDVIPADIVVNVILAAIAKHGGYKQRRPVIYQVASSASNPLTMRKIADVSYDHFKKYPMVVKKNWKNSLQAIKEIKVNYVVFLKSEAVFRCLVYLFLELPLMIFSAPHLENDKRFSKPRIALKYQLENINNLVKTYKPYLFYEGRFDATNSEKLLNQVSSEEQELFGYTVKDLDWYTYLNKSHLPGLRQHVLNWKQTGRTDPNWTIIDPLPERDLPPTQRTLRCPSRGLFQLPVRREYDNDSESA